MPRSPERGRRMGRGAAPLWPCLALTLAQPALSQTQTSGQRAWAVEPTLSVSETLTNNFRAAQGPAASDAITRLTAGVGLRANGSAVRGYLDYAVNGLAYARHSGYNDVQNALSSQLGASFAEGRAALNAEASISQGAISAVGAQPGTDGRPNGNSTEVRQLRLTPSWQSLLGPWLRIQAQFGYARSSGQDTQAGDATTKSANLSLSPASAGRLGWSLTASRQRTSFGGGRATDDDRLGLSGLYALDALDLQLSATAGVESTDIASVRRESHDNWGLGLVWAPSPRTRVAARWDQRFFGGSHNLSAEYRTARTVWQLASARSLSSGADAAAGGRGTIFDVFFAQFASVEPDPARRAELVNAFLRANNIDPRAIVAAGFLQSSASIQSLQSATLGWRGQRSNATVLLSRSSSRRADSLTAASDDLAGGARVRQRQVSLNLSHRLTPESSLSLTLSRQQGDSSGVSQRNDQRAATLGYALRLSERASFSASLYRTVNGGQGNAYNESALTATYGLRF